MVHFELNAGSMYKNILVHLLHLHLHHLHPLHKAQNIVLSRTSGANLSKGGKIDGKMQKSRKGGRNERTHKGDSFDNLQGTCAAAAVLSQILQLGQALPSCNRERRAN
jgi:hypothetical protein